MLPRKLGDQKMNKLLLLTMVGLLALAACETPVEVTSFEECEAAGYPVMESYPRQCQANGEVFTEELDQQVLDCEEEHLTYCPSLGECVDVRTTHCEEYSQWLREPVACTLEWAPVCGELQVPRADGVDTIRMTFGNNCAAQAAGAENIVQGECGETTQDVYAQCANLGGTPLPEYGECEYISQADCQALGGEFLECESACRNDPDYPDVICTMQCVLVCSFN